MIAAGADPERISVIPNMADLRMFSRHEAGPSWRSEVGIPDDAFVGIHHGTMGLVNDVGQLLDTAALLKDSGIYFGLVGQGNQRAALEERARREGLDNVVFDGPRARDMMPWVLQSADVGLMCVKHVPALYHNCANKFGDFLAAALPVVVTYPGWQGDFLEKHEAGLVADTSQGPEGLAEALLKMKANPAWARGMGANALTLGREEFARDELVRRFEQVLTRAVNG
jgi:glycosyltransferase involved in cell wall biosynthesis